MTQTFEELITDEFYRPREGMCLSCGHYCWLHNPLIFCRQLDSLEINSSDTVNYQPFFSLSPDNHHDTKIQDTRPVRDDRTVRTD